MMQIEAFAVHVDRSMAWTQLLLATGLKLWDNAKQDFTDHNFPFGEAPDCEYDLVLVEFDQYITDEEVLEKFNRQGLGRPEVEDLLAFTTAHPKIQLKFKIVALIAHPWRGEYGREYVPYLLRLGSERCLALSRIDRSWDWCYRFLARRPRKSK